MKDLDFDEIDRAVNSLKSSAPTEPADSEGLALPLVKQRSSGQFMDVVHPSSNMRRVPQMYQDRPSTPQIKPDDKPEELSEKVTLSENKPEKASNNVDWPDPIDFQKPSPEVTVTDEKTDLKPAEDADIDQISDDITNELSHKSDEFADKANEMPDSPFISGTKVEKRPLGAFSNDPTLEKTDNPDSNTASEAEKTEVQKPVNKSDGSLPEELQDDLLLIESGDDSTNTAEHTPSPVETKAEVVKEEVPKDDSKKDDAKPVVPTSITQQYKEQPSTGDQSNGAIYNTDAYHKPLIKPAKKKTSWMWILWIFILIILGVGVGVAVYKFVLPLL